MRAAPVAQIGLALGSWGAVQATCAGSAVAFGGIARDTISGLAMSGALGPALVTNATGYSLVYLLEIILLFLTIAVIGPLVRPSSAVIATNTMRGGLAGSHSPS
jgi:BCD family chlorophyll transporter-like MFS transporter